LTLAGADAPGTTTVHLEGDIDVTNANEIAERICAVLEGRHAEVVVECSAVTFVESRGLAMMARVQRFAEDAGRRLAWRGLSVQVLRTLHVSGLDTYLTIEP
jgi:anti-sigma B factor antagonist